MQKNDFNLLLENLNINNEKLIEIAIGTSSYNDIAAHIDADSGLCEQTSYLEKSNNAL